MIAANLHVQALLLSLFYLSNMYENEEKVRTEKGLDLLELFKKLQFCKFFQVTLLIALHSLYLLFALYYYQLLLNR